VQWPLLRERPFSLALCVFGDVLEHLINRIYQTEAVEVTLIDGWETIGEAKSKKKGLL